MGKGEPTRKKQLVTLDKAVRGPAQRREQYSRVAEAERQMQTVMFYKGNCDTVLLSLYVKQDLYCQARQKMRTLTSGGSFYKALESTKVV